MLIHANFTLQREFLQATYQRSQKP
jgi:hypothetical protein